MNITTNGNMQLAVWYLKNNYKCPEINDVLIQEIADYYDVNWIKLSELCK